MSVNKKQFNDPEISNKVVELYTTTLKTAKEIQELLGTTPHTVQAIIKRDIPDPLRSQLINARYAGAKLGEQNPMHGKTGEKHPRYRGECPDHRGYLTELREGKRYFKHRIVFAEKVLKCSVEDLPPSLHIHHIDQNTENNHPSNLIACTAAAHKAIHSLYKRSPEELKLRNMSLVEAIQYLTSK